MIELAAKAFAPGDIIDHFTADNPDAGAIVTMIGKVRSSANGEAVQSLTIDHYPDVTEQAIATEIATARQRWPLTGVQVVHRVGDILPGKTIVLVATAAIHRRAAFEAADYLMDYLKTGAYFWKKEVTDAAVRWIEPRDQDYDDAARWRNDT